MTDHLHVDPAVLRAAAGAAGRIGAELHIAIRRNAPRLIDSGAAGGWAASQALGQCSDAWEMELTKAAQAVHNTSDNLARAANRYADLDRTVAGVLSEFMPKEK
ncbi:MAG TPA: type VII secretion target [Amycolatopsis sp.]|jgi:uncharacterized protein YukE|nr:type VII secretion target [Amycolatopsis sp.]